MLMTSPTYLAVKNLTSESFLLTEAEFSEGVTSAKSFSNSTFGKAFFRIICGAGAILFAIPPVLVHRSWSEFIGLRPGRAEFTIALILLDLWVVAGTPGATWLSRKASRLDWQRRFAFTDSLIEISWGKHILKKPWNAFQCYRETQNV
jgi:hypothetical protein